MTTIFVDKEDDLSGSVSRHFLDRLVIEKATRTWVREQWADSPEFARKYHPLKKSFQARIPGGLDGHAKTVFRAMKQATAARELSEDSLHVLLVAGDADNQLAEHTRRRGVDVVRASAKTFNEKQFGKIDFELVVIVAEATPEFDAWVLMGHEPATPRAKKVLDEVKKELTFDPRLETHRLNSTTKGVRDAKRICERVLELDGQARFNDPAVQSALTRDTQTLRTRGVSNGFEHFVDDIEKKLLPLL